MPTELSTAQHLDALRVAMRMLCGYAEQAGPSAQVPTRPGWTVHQLLVHQGTAHRWAAALLRDDTPGEVRPEAIEAEGRDAPDPVAWLWAGAVELTATVEGAAADVSAIVFLNDAPPPRAFWARRSCHETTLHAVDALGAVLGRAPRAEETWIEAELAVDGIDELLAGFSTRPRSLLRCDDELTLAVTPVDAPDWWEVRVGPHPAVTTRRTRSARGVEAFSAPVADAELTGPAVEIYLRLWDRTPAPAGEVGKFDRSEDWQRRGPVGSRRRGA